MMVVAKDKADANQSLDEFLNGLTRSSHRFPRHGQGIGVHWFLPHGRSQRLQFIPLWKLHHSFAKIHDNQGINSFCTWFVSRESIPSRMPPDKIHAADFQIKCVQRQREQTCLLLKLYYLAFGFL